VPTLPRSHETTTSKGPAMTDDRRASFVATMLAAGSVALAVAALLRWAGWVA
jgi:hypothetical protein